MNKSVFFSLASLALVFGLTACSKSDSPTAPRPSPTPQAVSVSLTVSSTTAIAGQVVEARATVRQGSSAVPDGTVVNFTLPRQTCWYDRNNDNQQQQDELGLCYYFIDNSDVSLAKSTQGGVASAAWTSGTAGDVSVSASVGSASDTKTVRFSFPQQADPPQAAPRFYSVNPSFGSARGGYNATISGQWLCKAYFGGSCMLPADVTMRQVFRVVDQVIVQPSGTIVISYKDVSRDVALRVISQSGTGLQDSLVVAIPEADSSFLDQNVKVAIVINNGFTGQGGGSTEVPNAFEYQADYLVADRPEIFEVVPSQGAWQGGEEVTITGRNLCVLFWTSTGLCETRYAPSVNFNPGSWAQVVSVSPDGRALRVRTPSVSVVPITQDIYSTVEVRNATGPVAIDRAFVYVANNQPGVAPVLYALSPNAGPIEGGTRVTIFGSGFQYPVQVLFGDREAQVISSNFNQIVCIAPSIAPSQPGTPTIVQVSVTNVLTGKTSSNTLPYRYGEAMFISAIQPNTGYILGWNPATIYGQGFVAPVQVEVTAGSITKQAEVLSVSGTSIQVKMPPFAELAGGDQGCTPVAATFKVTNIGSNVSATGPVYTYLCSGGISGP